MEKINKNKGINSSEEYLNRLASNAFLSLWSYSNPYKEKGKELCDFLVVFGNQILIFSIKSCNYFSGQDEKIKWKRWLNRAIKKSAKQLWGAERWINNHPRKVFLDPKCQNKFPFAINPAEANIHLILVALGVSEECKKYFNGGNGSLILYNNIKGFSNHKKPFMIGDLDPSKTFIHILDDTTLNIIINTLDTISDFTSYISKKEEIFRSNRGIYAAGEEDLLPYYLKGMSGDEHDFDFPENADFFISEGEWDKFCKNPQRKVQIKENEVSYLWDSLIEKFNKHSIEGTLYESSSEGIDDPEKILRIFASEPRYIRRLHGKGLLDFFKIAKHEDRAFRAMIPSKTDPRDGTGYVFMTLKPPKEIEYDKYRRIRSEILQIYCRGMLYKNPHIKKIIGIAMEPSNIKYGSQNLVLIEQRDKWTEEDKNMIKKGCEHFDILREDSLNISKMEVKEYPEIHDK